MHLVPSLRADEGAARRGWLGRPGAAAAGSGEDPGARLTGGAAAADRRGSWASGAGRGGPDLEVAETERTVAETAAEQ